jgi:hypothetical protein
MRKIVLTIGLMVACYVLGLLSTPRVQGQLRAKYICDKNVGQGCDFCLQQGNFWCGWDDPRPVFYQCWAEKLETCQEFPFNCPGNKYMDPGCAIIVGSYQNPTQACRFVPN